MSANGKKSATYTATGLLLASLFGVAPIAQANDWTSLGLDATRARATDEKSGATFSPAWNVNPSGAPYVASPIVVDGFVVVAGTKGDVSALSVVDGHEAWTVKAAGGIGSSPAVANGHIFVSTLDGHMQALRLGTGAQLWQRAFGGQNYASPLLVSDARGPGLVLGAGFPDQKVVRLSASTGDTQWETAPDAVAGLVSSSAALGAGRVVFGMNGGRIQGLDLATGATAWKADGKGAMGLSAPLVVGGTAYFLPGGSATALYAADATTGELLTGWPVEVLDPAAPEAATVSNKRNIVSSPALLGDLIVFVSRFEYDLKAVAGVPGKHVLREILAAVSPATGTVAWQQEIGRRDVESINDIPELSVSPTPLSFATDSNPLVAVASSVVPQVRVLDLGGKQVWSASLSAPTRSSPVLANGLLVVATDVGVVHAFSSDANHAPAAPAAGFEPEEGQMVDGPTPVLKWGAAADAEGQAVRYQVRVLAENGDLYESPLAELTTNAGEAQITLERGVVSPGLAYRYAVRSRDASGAWSTWTPPRSFIVAVKPPISVDGKAVDSIADAVSAIPVGGGTITLGRGVLHLREALELPAGVSLVGASAQDTIIDATGLSVAVKMASSGSRTGAPALKNVTVAGADVGVQVIDVQGAVLRNVVVRDNKKVGVQIEEGAAAEAINVTLARNGVGAVVAGKLGIRSSIVSANETGLSRTGAGTLTSRYNDLFGNKTSDYDGLAAGTGDISAAVSFRSTADFHVATRQASTDQGDPADEFAQEPSPNGARVNMGAFGNTPSAELSLTQNGWKAVAGAASSTKPATMDPPAAPGGGGSGCAVGGTPAPASAGWLALALGALFSKRRRKG